MKKIAILIFLFSVIIIPVTGQEKAYEELGEYMRAGFYEKALPLIQQLKKFKRNDAALLMEAHIIFEQRKYQEAEKLFEKIKKEKHKKTQLPIFYFLDLKTIYAYNKMYDKAIQLLLQLKSKIDELSDKDFAKYRKLYFEDLETPKSPATFLAYLDDELKLLQAIKNRYELNQVSNVELESFKKVDIKNKGLFTGIGKDQINQDLVSVKLNADEGIEVNPKDKYKNYYMPYGFKFTDNNNRTLPALRSHFYAAGIVYDPISKKYMYSKQHTQQVELTKKQQKAQPNLNRNFMAFFESDKIEENATLVNLDYQNFDYVHPAITQNGKYLYFSSNKDNHINYSYDIYYVKRASNNEWDWGNMIKLSDKINTPFNELYPTISGDTLLTIASNGVEGYGGYDIVGIRLKDGLPTDEIFLFPMPVNSHRDDFGYEYIEERRAKFYSNRDSIHLDEKYEIEYPLPFVKLIVKVSDKNTGQPLDNFTVNLFDGKTKINRLTPSTGMVIFDSLLSKNTFQVSISREKYLIVNNNQEVKFNKNQKELTIEFKAFKKLEKKDKIEFRDILFEYDKADLLPQSYVELDKILQIIKDNPYAKFELSAHTDSRGKDAYNLKLSQKRAESCVNYLLSKGVSSSAIIAKGYGEKQLKNNCGNNVKCSEEEHAINRRVEIKVIDIKE